MLGIIPYELNPSCGGGFWPWSLLWGDTIMSSQEQGKPVDSEPPSLALGERGAGAGAVTGGAHGNAGTKPIQPRADVNVGRTTTSAPPVERESMEHCQEMSGVARPGCQASRQASREQPRADHDDFDRRMRVHSYRSRGTAQDNETTATDDLRGGTAFECLRDIEIAPPAICQVRINAPNKTLQQSACRIVARIFNAAVQAGCRRGRRDSAAVGLVVIMVLGDELLR